jgi:hypothetical protein
MSTTQTTDYLSSLKNMDEDFQCYIIMGIIFILLIFMIGYIIYLRRLKNSECDYMNNLYSAVNGKIRPINSSDPDCSGNLYDYYIKTAYNACSGGSYKNDFVDICNLKAVIKQGVRCLDFEVYSVDNEPVVATSTQSDFYIKETFNSVNFADVMKTIKDYAFSGGTCPNSTDPLLIHLRIKSTNQKIYTKMAEIFKSYDTEMLGKEYSFENGNTNLGTVPLLQLQNKIIIIVERNINNSNAFLENKEFLEYVNLTSNSMFMRALHFDEVKNNPDVNELTDYNRRNMTIVFPDKGINPPNPAGLLCRTYGCQMVAIRYQYVDNFLIQNTMMFDRAGYAFDLKPQNLRYTPVTIPDPEPQNPAFNYASRPVSSDYYSFSM